MANTPANTQPKPWLWKAGQSGNPGGRPAVLADLQELARKHTPRAIAALAKALDSPRERVAAATALLDRAYGKPRQQVEVSGDDDAIGLHLLAARLIATELAAAYDQPRQPALLEARAEARTDGSANPLDAPAPTE